MFCVQGVESTEHCVETMSIGTQLVHGVLFYHSGDLNPVCYMRDMQIMKSRGVREPGFRTADLHKQQVHSTEALLLQAQKDSFPEEIKTISLGLLELEGDYSMLSIWI